MQHQIEYRYLRAFITLGECLSFSETAKKLSIAQSAVSRQIKLLEESLGIDLVIRSSQNVMLTEAGLKLYESALLMDEASRELTRENKNTLIKIGILHGLLEEWFQPVLREIIESTDYQMQIIIGSQNDLKKKMENNKLDLLFTTENIQSELMSTKKLFEEELVLVSKNEISRNQINKYPWLIYSKYDPLLTLHERNDARLIQVESITAILKLVETTRGVAVVPKHLLPKDSSLYQSNFELKERSSIYLGMQNYTKLPTPIEKIISLIEEQC